MRPQQHWIYPVAKTNDPVTSWEAGEEIHETGTAQRHVEIILCTLSPHHSLTSAEIAAECELDRWQVARRLPEMERKNLAERWEIRKCAVTNRKCVTWLMSE